MSCIFFLEYIKIVFSRSLKKLKQKHLTFSETYGIECF